MPTFAFLVPVDPGLCVIPLEKAVVLVGRQSDCDISLTQSRKVSRRHCCLAQVNNQIMARDLGSTNGIYLNGERVKRQCKINVGDEFVIGDLKFRLLLDPNPQPPANPVVTNERKRPPADANGTDSTKPTPPPPPGPRGKATNVDGPVILPEPGNGIDFRNEPSIPEIGGPIAPLPRPVTPAPVDDSSIGSGIIHSDDDSIHRVQALSPDDDSVAQPPVKPPVEDDSGLRLNQNAAAARPLPPGASGPLVPPFSPDESSSNIVPLGEDSIFGGPKRK